MSATRCESIADAGSKKTSDPLKTFYTMTTPTIQFYEVFEEEEIALRRHLPAGWECCFTPRTIQESGHQDPPATVLSIRTQSVIPDAWSQRIQAVLSRSAGFDHLQRYAARTSTRAEMGHLFRYSGRAVAEQAALMWMALLRRLPAQTAALPTFSRDHLTGRECAGRTLAVFGVGDIGYQAARIGRGLDMTVLGVDVDPRHADIDYVSPGDAVSNADVILCSMNLTPDNDGYFSRGLLDAAGSSTVFVNVARGEFIRTTLLLELLASARLGGVGLDVFHDETIAGPVLRAGSDTEHPEIVALRELASRHDAILTPHNGFNTIEAVERKSAQTAEQLGHYFANGRFRTYT